MKKILFSVLTFSLLISLLSSTASAGLDPCIFEPTRPYRSLDTEIEHGEGVYHIIAQERIFDACGGEPTFSLSFQFFPMAGVSQDAEHKAIITYIDKEGLAEVAFRTPFRNFIGVPTEAHEYLRNGGKIRINVHSGIGYDIKSTRVIVSIPEDEIAP